jgi:hypothetical protein
VAERASTSGFYGTVKRELFGHEVYHSVLGVQFVVDAWTETYKTMRIHGEGPEDRGRHNAFAQAGSNHNAAMPSPSHSPPPESGYSARPCQDVNQSVPGDGDVALVAAGRRR